MNYFFLENITYFNKLTKLGNYLCFEFISAFKHELKKGEKFYSLSLWTEFSDTQVFSMEETVSKIIRYNRELEEKERLFKEKVKELRSIFLEGDLDSLKKIKFETEESIIESDETTK